MIVVRRVLMLWALATAGCESGPTSEWPHNGAPDEDDGNDESQRLDGGASGSAMDAAVRADGSSKPPTQDCDAGDAGADSGCPQQEDAGIR
ncbi:MAG TPA: hypothetical protein VFX59_18065 [Polyangiales bacterium]|nr:hypothetical protein [Polyangiales bacterium]